MRTLHTISLICAMLLCGACDCVNPVSPTGSGLLRLTVTGATTLSVGQSTALVATADYADGRREDVTASATWAVASTPICSVSAGLVQGLAAGVCGVSATLGQASDLHELEVGDATGPGGPTVPVVDRALFITGLPSMTVGQQVQWTATLSVGGEQQPVTNEATWASDAPGVAGVSSTGLVTASSMGATMIRATLDGISAAGPVQVVSSGAPAPTVTGLEIQGAACTTVGQVAQLQAIATLSNGASQNVTTLAQWTSGHPPVASVAGGLVGCLAPGTTTVSVAYEGQSATKDVTVSDGNPVVPGQVVITGTPCSLSGASAMLQAMLGSENVTNAVQWTSNSPAVATIAGTGLLTCVGPGTTTVAATLVPHAPGMLVVTVTDPPAERVLTGLELVVEAEVLGGGETFSVDVPSLLEDPILDVHINALYSDGTKDDVTSSATLDTDSPFLRVDGPGVLNAAGVLTQALVDPDHVVNAEYGGFTVQAGVHVSAPVVGDLPISALQVPAVAGLAVGTKLPDATAVLDDGAGGSAELLLPAGTNGLAWRVEPVDYVPILGPVLGTTVNSTLAPLGNLVGSVIGLSDGTVQSVNVGPLAGILSLLGGELQVQTRAVVDGVASSPALTTLSLSGS